jgi:hypothetical protein
MVAKPKPLEALLINQAINLIWTALFFTPTILFWILYYDAAILFCLLAISLFPLLLNEALLRFFQLSSSKKFYEQIGIRKFQAVTQDGRIVKNLINKRHVDYSIIGNRRDIELYKKQINIYEKYHLICMLFFSGSAIYGLINSEYYLSALILVSNIFYNVVPLLIQQYNKIRIEFFWDK